jgi:hypothetical protein
MRRTEKARLSTEEQGVFCSDELCSLLNSSKGGVLCNPNGEWRPRYAACDPPALPQWQHQPGVQTYEQRMTQGQDAANMHAPVTCPHLSDPCLPPPSNINACTSLYSLYFPSCRPVAAPPPQLNRPISTHLDDDSHTIAELSNALTELLSVIHTVCLTHHPPPPPPAPPFPRQQS